MAGVDIGRKRWKNATAPIDWSHPSAAGLHAMVVTDGTARIVEKVRGLTPDTITPTSTRTVSKLGYAATFPNSTTVGGAVWSLTSIPYLAPPLTLHCVYTPSTIHDSSIANVGGSSTNGVGWRLGVTDTNIANLRMTFFGVADYDVTGALVAGVELAVTISISGGTATFYKNASVISSQAVGTPVTTNQTDGLGIGCHRRLSANTSGPSNTPISMVALWNRPMGQSEVAALNTDPFCMLRN